MISVVATVYNGQTYLSQAIDSVLAQSWEDFGHMLGAAASTGHSRESISTYARTDSRIRLVFLSKNGGRCEAFNEVVRTASQERVARLDADDEWRPEKLARQWSFLASHQEVSVVGSYATYIDAHGRELGLDW